MVFGLQRYLEDIFSRNQLTDSDSYAVRLANQISGELPDNILRSIRSVRTRFYAVNALPDRKDFEEDLARRLKKTFGPVLASQKDGPALGVEPYRRRISRLPRRTIRHLLEEFRAFAEVNAVDVLWKSRRRGVLRESPEDIVQTLLAGFLRGTLGKRGFVLREHLVGTGYVDIAVVIGLTKHLVEMKIVQGDLAGVSQLDRYMKLEQRREGWLVVFDTRPESRKTDFPRMLKRSSGTIHVITIDANPTAPSKLDART